MRQIHLIHGDIKIENLMYSRGWRKYVLIDFGLSKFLKEKPNEKTETYFQGTADCVGE